LINIIIQSERDYGLDGRGVDWESKGQLHDGIGFTEVNTQSAPRHSTVIRIIEIGMAAVRPAAFIILKFSQKMQES
jgi:hypothetical protein